ncbi:lipopolysaccharide biosynthesis protein [Mangrovibacterium lignilyticum]|uniref:lipopolysaccharide biosynthesis protein n=1 Tax=Mangrovibacterium lignilyticum TaxID=2668052 RepID=UPI0013D00456|nr:polysaccharide biosynthesis C-terminal domain-containing protein [Mangrovibacterium lignilyticum]
MGIIIKQSIKGSIWSYLGVIIGFVTTTYLYSQYLSTEVVGLFGLLAAYSALTGQLFLFGIQGVTSRLFPYFRNPENKHNGFLFIALLVIISGFLVFLVAYYFFKPIIVASNLEKSPLFAKYVFLLVPLTFFSMAFIFLENYNRLLYDAVTGTFYQEFIQRVLLFSILMAYSFSAINLHQLILFYATAICLKGLLIFITLAKRGEIGFKPNLSFLAPELGKEMLSVATYSVLVGMGSIFVFNIDKIFINQMLDLSNTGVYTIAFYFGTLVVIPSRPLLKISGTLIAEAWKQNDISQIKNIYYKSCLNQFIIGGFLFLGIWANIDNILTILGPAYLQSKWVIFFIGLGYLIDMSTGANGLIIAYSKYYKVALIFIVTMIVISTSLLYFLIPIWGITGAAIAIAIALLSNNLMRYLFLWHKFKLQPFNSKFLIVAGFYIGVYLVLKFIPQQPLIWDIVTRGGLITLFSGTFLTIIPVSTEIIQLWNKIRALI